MIPIERIDSRAYRVPTSGPEQDGTYAWSATTLVVVRATAGGTHGTGYSYGSAAMVPLIRDQLAPCVRSRDAMAVEQAWWSMIAEVRNVGRPGVASTAISAVDASLWDLKARLLGLSLVPLLGAVREAVPVYGSGGFTNSSVAELQQQLGQWADAGIRRVKMKVGAAPDDDVARVRSARAAVGDDVALMVDANGAYSRTQALGQATAFADLGVTWFEEPVSSDDLEGLRLLRDRVPAAVAIAAGEYGWDPWYFRRMLEAGAVDVLQADATRCLGITGFLAAGRLCDVFHVPLSAHTAPLLHAAVACCVRPLVHVEYFHDHARLEAMLFEGAGAPVNGQLLPDVSRPGLGFEFREADAEPFALTA